MTDEQAAVIEIGEGFQAFTTSLALPADVRARAFAGERAPDMVFAVPPPEIDTRSGAEILSSIKRWDYLFSVFPDW